MWVLVHRSRLSRRFLFFRPELTAICNAIVSLRWCRDTHWLRCTDPRWQFIFYWRMLRRPNGTETLVDIFLLLQIIWKTPQWLKIFITFFIDLEKVTLEANGLDMSYCWTGRPKSMALHQSTVSSPPGEENERWGHDSRFFYILYWVEELEHYRQQRGHAIEHLHLRTRTLAGAGCDHGSLNWLNTGNNFLPCEIATLFHAFTAAVRYSK